MQLNNAYSSISLKSHVAKRPSEHNKMVADNKDNDDSGQGK